MKPSSYYRKLSLRYIQEGEYIACSQKMHLMRSSNGARRNLRITSWIGAGWSGIAHWLHLTRFGGWPLLVLSIRKNNSSGTSCSPQIWKKLQRNSWESLLHNPANVNSKQPSQNNVSRTYTIQPWILRKYVAVSLACFSWIERFFKKSQTQL